MLAYDRAMRESRDINRGATQGVTVHPKLQVSSPNDPAERKADAIADKVMRVPEPSNASCSTCGTPIPDDAVHRKCAACDNEEQIHPKHQNSINSGMTVSGPTAEGIRSLSGGQPIPEVDRSFMEPRFSRDFSDVRLHTGSKASELSESINARAFTHGNNIAFQGGEYRPGTERGRRLLAHELGHVKHGSTQAVFLQTSSEATYNGYTQAELLEYLSWLRNHLGIQNEWESDNLAVGVIDGYLADEHYFDLDPVDMAKLCAEIVDGYTREYQRDAIDRLLRSID